MRALTVFPSLFPSPTLSFFCEKGSSLTAPPLWTFLISKWFVARRSLSENGRRRRDRAPREPSAGGHLAAASFPLRAVYISPIARRHWSHACTGVTGCGESVPPSARSRCVFHNVVSGSSPGFKGGAISSVIDASDFTATSVIRRRRTQNSEMQKRECQKTYSMVLLR